ncbi:hypothetical protein [Rhodococcus sp. SORGH_AS_0301]|uniref:hypothetical protein n=1 Tax=Rhodococcus sp. SORGH_AS_0301 TaxID=3041780 RepID=UPI00277D6B96|nr:hypothetical protein [Rhodococcus sp. SORGH_AS_0301]MDQ1181864.1 hypothetical protein [Rhodococcus sp. SORGH_AS_0301]
MVFEVFNKRNAPLGKSPSVTIQKRGIFSMNRAAHALIENSDTIELLYDKDEQIIGFRPAEDSTLHGYPVRPQSNAKSTGPVLVAGFAFTQYYGIDTTVSMRYSPRLVDGILCIDLKDGGQPIVGNRTPKSDRNDASDDE